MMPEPLIIFLAAALMLWPLVALEVIRDNERFARFAAEQDARWSGWTPHEGYRDNVFAILDDVRCEKCRHVRELHDGLCSFCMYAREHNTTPPRAA